MILNARPPDDVPVVVDAVKAHDYFPMVRCNYFSIECDSPKSGWSIRIGNGELPFMMLGLVGIVTRPFAAARFNNIELIEDLYKRIEDEAGLLVDVDDIWLPMFLFDRIKLKPEIGHVYRIKGDIFTAALAYREGRLDLESFRDRCERLELPLILSEGEMSAFQRWRELQIQNAIERYPKNGRLELHWHEE